MAPMMISTSEVIRNSFSDHSRSKAQMCLKKIIDIIISSSSVYYSSSSSSSSSSKSKSKTTRVRRGIDIDLNLRLGLPSEESEEMKGLISGCSGVRDEGIKVCGLVIGSGDDCNSSSSVVSGGECDDEMSRGNKKGKQVVIDEQEFSEITNLLPPPPIGSSEVVVVVAGEQSEIKSDKEDEKFQRKEYKNEEGGYLGLLIEAARLISENEEKGNEEKRKNRVELEEKTGNESWMLDLYDGFEDISPVVKSKRGRNQVLPFRYRDSVLDPWKRISRQRSSKNQLHSCTTRTNKTSINKDLRSSGT